MKKSVLLPLILVSLHCQAQFKDFSFRAAATFPLIANTNERVELNMVPISAAAGYNAVVVRTGTVRQSFQGKADSTLADGSITVSQNVFFSAAGSPRPVSGSGEPSRWKA